MKRFAYFVLVLGLLGCGKQESRENTEEKKKPPSRVIPASDPYKKSPKQESKAAQKEPDKPLVYTYGDLVLAFQEDAKARQYLASGGRVTGVDPRLYKADARHEAIRAVIAEQYEGAELNLANVLKLRDELCKANELTPDQVNALPLEEVVKAFKKE
jgi:hypothetical protein